MNKIRLVAFLIISLPTAMMIANKFVQFALFTYISSNAAIFWAFGVALLIYSFLGYFWAFGIALFVLYIVIDYFLIPKLPGF